MTQYKTLTVSSPFAIKRFAHNSRFNIYRKRIELFCKGNVKSFLDYGTGDGHIFKKLSDRKYNNIKCFGFEPVSSQYDQLLDNVKNNNLNVTCLNSLGTDMKFDYILCAETLEHFSAINVIKHLKTFENLLSNRGRVLISVPIEIGFGGLCKNLVRWSIGGLHEGLGVKNAIYAFFGKPIYRGNDDYIASHTGFSHKNLEYLIIDNGWKIKKKFFSTIPFVGSMLNSQVFFEIERR